jgi:hypothetical protein
LNNILYAKLARFANAVVGSEEPLKTSTKNREMWHEIKFDEL